MDGAGILMGLPMGRYDGHAHVFQKSLIMDASRRYTPKKDAPLNDYVALLREHRLDGALLVQPSFLGFDNSFLLATLKRARSFDDLTFRGVAVVLPGTSYSDLSKMKDNGIVGIRLNLVEQPPPDFISRNWLALFENANRLGWHVEVHLEGIRLAETLPILLEHCETIVLDHFGLPDATTLVECTASHAIFHSNSKRLFVKTSAPYRVFPDISPDEAAGRATKLYEQLLQALGSDRLVWGSDWPWTRYEGQHEFCQTLEWLQLWTRSRTKAI